MAHGAGLIYLEYMVFFRASYRGGLWCIPTAWEIQSEEGACVLIGLKGLGFVLQCRQACYDASNAWEREGFWLRV